MMQLVVPEALSFPCAKLVKAMAALISLQYVSSLPLIFIRAAPTPPPPLMMTSVEENMDMEKDKTERVKSHDYARK